MLVTCVKTNVLYSAPNTNMCFQKYKKQLKKKNLFFFLSKEKKHVPVRTSPLYKPFFYIYIYIFLFLLVQENNMVKPGEKKYKPYHSI